MLDRIHELNGITGYAHQGESFHGYRGMTMDILDNKVDFLEILQFCVDGGPLLVRHYYHFLDLGYKITETAGSDFPWCGIGPTFGVDGPNWNARIGNVRFYTHLGKEFSYDLWKREVKAGHTFVSSGPMLDFTVNGHGFHNPETSASYLELNEKYLDELEAELDAPHENLEYRAYWYRKGLKSRIETTRQVIEKLKNK